MDDWWVYIIEEKTGLYVGITTDLENRMRQHGQPVPLYYEGPISKADALKRERTLKGWSRKKKLELITKTSSQERSVSPGLVEGPCPESHFKSQK
jgi:predicted GIY-YIG superfamily endonuclease